MDISYFQTNDFIAGGLIVSMFAASITVIWEKYSKWQEEKAEDSEVIESIKGTISYNYSLLDSGIKLINKEMDVLSRRESVVHPLSDFVLDLDLIMTRKIPQKIMKRDGLYRRIRTCFIRMRRCNGIIASRETYKITCGAMDNYHRRIGIYDAMIIELYMEIKQDMEVIIGEVEKL